MGAQDRRRFLKMAVGAGVSTALAQTPRDWSGRNPIQYPDPDVTVVDKRFEKYKVGNAAIERLYTGLRWAEGPAWSSVGGYLVLSDIPNDRQLRWMEEDGHVSVYRKHSNYSNGNTFDYEGRQLSCEHLSRRVVRYEPNGEITVLADKWQGKPLNAPNDIVVHPDGGIWFTDPGYGIMGQYEGSQSPIEIKEAVYRIDGKTAKMEKVTEDLEKPNGLCFSPDYKKLYICDTGAPKNIKVYDVADGKSIKGGRQFVSMGAGLGDGIRADVDGNIWTGAGWVGKNYDGVHIFSPAGERIGMILLPEICANVCFGGTHRNRLFMAASQSLYSVYVNTRGAHIA